MESSILERFAEKILEDIQRLLWATLLIIHSCWHRSKIKVESHFRCWFSTET